MTEAHATDGSMTRIDFHFPVRKRSQKQIDMPTMCAVAKIQAQ